MNNLQTRWVGFAVTSSAEKYIICQTRLYKILFHVRDESCVAIPSNIQCSIRNNWYDRNLNCNIRIYTKVFSVDDYFPNPMGGFFCYFISRKSKYFVKKNRKKSIPIGMAGYLNCTIQSSYFWCHSNVSLLGFNFSGLPI